MSDALLSIFVGEREKQACGCALTYGSDLLLRPWKARSQPAPAASSARPDGSGVRVNCVDPESC
jgi:hypothetical protein